MKNKFSNIWKGVIEFCFHYLLRLLPMDFCSYLGYWVGRLFLRDQAAELKIRKNIALLRPEITAEDEIENIIQNACGNLGRVKAEFSVLRRIWRSDRTIVEGLNNLSLARASGRPRIFLFLHLGNWEVIGPKILDLGEDGFETIEILKNPFHQYIVNSIRKPYKKHLVTSDQNAARTIYKKLKSGGVLVLTIDEFAKGKVCGPRFGREYHLETNLAKAIKFAKMTNAVLCPIYAIRTRAVHFSMQILPPVFLDFADFNQEKLYKYMQKLDQIFDPIVRQHLDQWWSIRRNLD